MNFLSKSIAKKVYFQLFLVDLLIIGLVFGVSIYFPVNDQLKIVLGLSVFIIILSTWIVYYRDVVLPFKVILKEVKALLTGREYKKIFTGRTDEIGIFAYFFNEVTSNLEKVKLDLDESKKVTGELRIAGQLQKELIPLLAPRIPGFEICVKNRSAEELGGDNLDFISVGDNTFFYVGDVTGHGVPAAIVMTMVNTLINAYSEIYKTTFEVVFNTNRRLKNRIKSTMFMSLLMLRWDNKEKKMTYVGCGHEHLVIYRAKTGKVDVTVSGGIALGMIVDNSKIIKEKDVPLETGDIIVLYTDGITEAKNMSGEMFGLKRLTQAVEYYGGQSDAEGLVQNIAREFSNFVEEHVQEDDVTLIAVKKLDQSIDGKSSIDHKQERWSDLKSV